MFDHLNLPYPEVTEYLQYSYESAHNARRTLELKVLTFKRFCDFMLQRGLTKLKDVHKEDLQAWFEHLPNDNIEAQTTMTLFTAHVFSMWRWAIAKGYHEAEETPLLRKSAFRFLGKKPKPKLILTPESIFQARTSGRGNLRQAVFFELMLCSGERGGEVVQLRASDIHWGNIPIDKELGMPSPYVAATIILEPRLHVVKGRRARRFYLSHIAARLLKIWMEERRIPLDSNLPLFPFGRNGTTDIMRRLSKNTKLSGVPVKVHSSRPDSPYDVDRLYALEDVNLSDVEDGLLRAMIVRARNREKRRQKILRMGPVGKRKEELNTENYVQRINKLYPHLLRYTYVSFMYYRLFTGERNNPLAIQLTTGHSVPKILLSYLIEHDLIQNDYIWKAMWLGKPDHWQHLIHGDSKTRLYGSQHQTGNAGKWGNNVKG